MAVYVDALRVCIPNAKWRWSQSCHLFADTLEELHAFAQQLKMRREWFQNHTRLPHYDLTAAKRRKAVKLGAIDATAAQMVEHMRLPRFKSSVDLTTLI